MTSTFELKRGPNPSSPGEDMEAYEQVRVVPRTFLSDELRSTAKSLAAASGLHPLIAQLLVQRGLETPEAAASFLAPSFKNSLPKPQSIKGIIEAARLILTHAEQNSRITVYTDFDVDGITAGTQLLLFLNQLGVTNSFRYTPDRFDEGYGLQKSAVERIANAGTSLLVTVDCGISSLAEVDKANACGMDVIIVDHHQPSSELPAAKVIVNPAQDGCTFAQYELCAAGLVWMLLIVLRSTLRDEPERFVRLASSAIPDPRDFIDLAGIGTICDMVPLTNINRLLAWRAVEQVRSTPRCGLGALLKASGVNPGKVSATSIAFTIGPRINAAGRLADTNEAFELLMTADSEKAKKIAQRLSRLNTKRQAIEGEMRDLCISRVLADPQLQNRNALVLYDKNFHQGVIGIVAQRLVETFNKPSIVLAPAQLTQHGKQIEIWKGSIRSIRGFDIAAVLNTLKPLLLTGGGHAMAGGCSIHPAKFDAFRDAFISAADELTSEDLQKTTFFDAVLTLADIDFGLVEQLQRLAPFGRGNSTPLFLSDNLRIEHLRSLSGNHLRLRLQQNEHSINAVAWGMRGHPALRQGAEISAVYSLDINSYNGVRAVQLVVKEVW